MQKSLHSEQNSVFLEMLRQARSAVGMTQAQLAATLELHQADISKVENGVRRLDVVELHTWLQALDLSFVEFAVEFDGRVSALRERRMTPEILKQRL